MHLLVELRLLGECEQGFGGQGAVLRLAVSLGTAQESDYHCSLLLRLVPVCVCVIIYMYLYIYIYIYIYIHTHTYLSFL